MTADLAIRNNGGALSTDITADITGTFSAEQVALIKSTWLPKASDADLALFAQVCQRTGLSPFTKQIYGRMEPVWDPDTRKTTERLVIIVGIDGWRVAAMRALERRHKEAFLVGPEWCGTDGQWRDVWLDDKPPAACRVGVQFVGHPQPSWGIATYREFAKLRKDGQPQKTWAEMPAHMLSVRAEAFAWRRTLPQDMADIELDEAYAPTEVDVLDPAAPADREYWRGQWFAALGKRRQTDEQRAELVRRYTRGAYHSLKDFMAEATNAQAQGLIEFLRREVLDPVQADPEYRQKVIDYQLAHGGNAMPLPPGQERPEPSPAERAEYARQAREILGTDGEPDPEPTVVTEPEPVPVQSADSRAEWERRLGDGLKMANDLGLPVEDVVPAELSDLELRTRVLELGKAIKARQLQ